MPQKRPQKSRPQIQKGLLNQKASGKKLSVVQGFSAGKALQEKLSDVQAFPYSVLNKGYLLNQKAIGEKLALSGPALRPPQDRTSVHKIS